MAVSIYGKTVPHPHRSVKVIITPAPKPARRPAAWRDDPLDKAADPLDPSHLPTDEALRAGMRHRSIGRILGDICDDLGVAPSLCLGTFWNTLFTTAAQYDGKPATYAVRRWRREVHFAKEQDRRPTLDLSWPGMEEHGRGHILRVLGFFIGEQPVEPPLILPPAPSPSAAKAPPPATPARPSPATAPMPAAPRAPATPRQAATGPP